MTLNTPETNPRRGALALGLALLVTLGLSACADPSGIAAQAPLRDAASLGLRDGPRAAAIRPDWWRSLGDPTLDALVAQSLRDSPNLKLAQARIALAQAAVSVTDAASGPRVDGQLALTHQRYTANGMVPPPLAGSVSDSGTLQVAGSWELDFFGRNQAALQAALGQADAAQADAQAARLLLASRVVQTYVQWSRLAAQREVAQQALAQAQQLHALELQRTQADLDARAELRQSEAALAQARAQDEALQEQIALTRHALAALTGQGRLPADLQPRALQALMLPEVQAVMPVDLLGQRPDIAAARWRVQAASAAVQSARAAFYPNVNLAAFAGLSSIGLDQLLHASSTQWGVTPALSLPLFDAGRLRANLRGRSAEADAAIESYNAAVIGAVREVADQLASKQAIERLQREQDTATRATEDVADSAQQRYQAGLSPRSSVLRAQAGVLEQRRRAIDLRARALDNRVALIHALGGGISATSTTVNP